MTDRVKEGIGGLCFAAIAGILGLALHESGVARLFVFLAVLTTIVSLAVIGTELSRKSPPD